MTYIEELQHKLPDFDEASASQIPALIQLVNLGYKYLTREEVENLRESKSSYILKDVAFKAIRKINNSDISDKSIIDSIYDIQQVNWENGAYSASEEIYSELIAGKAVMEFIDGKRTSPTMKFIDFKNPLNNTFHVAAEFELEEHSQRRPDIVLFVNGIPFAVIENKKQSVSVQDAVKQMIRNQRVSNTPKFFLYPQLLVACNVSEIKYATMLTPEEFWAVWKEKFDKKNEEQEKAQFEKAVYESINKKIEPEIFTKITNDLIRNRYEQPESRSITNQDLGIYSLLLPQRLLELVEGFVIYDNGIKKVARYQQYFAIKKILATIQEVEPSGKRKGGIVWHTQGSGKSLTMVMFVKNLIEKSGIELPRILIVTDRKDLDRQIRDTFKVSSINKKVKQATSGKELLKLIKTKDLSVITTLIHKFDSLKNLRGNFKDEDNNIFVLIDEGHRSQYGNSNIELNYIIPNACQIAFTGTPLLKKEKSIKKFGDIIDSYKISEAEEDGAVLPLIYQARYAGQYLAQENLLDKFYDRLCKNFSLEEKNDLKKKFASAKLVQQVSSRIEVIAMDIFDHYSQFKDTGMKAQVVAPSKYSAVLFKKAFDLYNDSCVDEEDKIETQVIISDSGADDADDDKLAEHKKEVAKFLVEEKHIHGSLETREKKIIKDFKENPDGCKIIIVVDKLLTGFDAPRNRFLYLAKELKEHNLLQAIARVNRVFNGDKGKEAKTDGVIIDYSENAKNLKDALALFSDYEPEDIEKALLDTDEKIFELNKTYQNLHEIFKIVQNPNDNQSYIDILEKSFKVQDEFYNLVSEFIKNFATCKALYDFTEKFDPEKLARYEKDLKKFVEIKKISKLMNAEVVDFSKYEDQIRRILNKYVSAKDVEILCKPIALSDTVEFNQYLENKENGLSDKSKAEAIAAQMEKITKERYDEDPEYYKKFSEKIKSLIEELKTAKKEDLKALLQKAYGYQEQVNKHEDDDIPASIKNNKEYHTYYRNIKPDFEKFGIEESNLVSITKKIYSILAEEKIVDWDKNIEVERNIKIRLEDLYFDEIKELLKKDMNIDELEILIDKIWNLAKQNKDNE